MRTTTRILLLALAGLLPAAGASATRALTGPDLSVTIYGSPAVVQQGEALTFFTVVQNKGGSGATGVKLQVTLPAGVTVTSTYADLGSACSVSGQVVTCPLDYVAVGAKSTTTIRTKVGSATAGLSASATVTLAQTDQNPADNTAMSAPILMQTAVGASTSGSVPVFGSAAMPPKFVDRLAPRIGAIDSAGRRGGVAKLHFSIYDDSGVAEARIKVERGRRVIATLRSGYGPVASGLTYYYPWHVPKGAKGPLSFCVRAADRAGHLSRWSCAPLRLAAAKR